MKKRKKIFYIINHTSFFVSHRLDLAKYARNSSYDIFLIVGRESSKKMHSYSKKILKKNKIQYFRANFSSSSINLFKELVGFFQVYNYCKNFKPDVIHTASPKANLIGGLVGKLLNVPSMVISISGQGYLYTKKNFINLILSNVYDYIFKYIFSHKNKKIILQNSEDYKKFVKIDNKKDCILIPGSGVNTKKFYNINSKHSKKNILYVGRILKDKGILEYIEASKIIKKKFPKWNFYVVGPKDYENPSKISNFLLKKWINEKNIKWFDYSPNMKKFYKNASIVCMPSHREGFSKVLLEAGASARPIVTSDVAGCKEAIIPNKTGLVFKSKNTKDLVKKLIILINDKNKRIKYGVEGRKLVKSKFDIKIINKRIINIYKNLIKNAER